MSKKRKKQKKEQIKLANKSTHLNKWLSIAAFIAVGFIIFYPPFFRGLFFPEDMFVYHIFTALAFILVWADKIHRKDYSLIQSPLDLAVLAYAIAYLLSLLGAVHSGEAFYGFLKALNFFMVYWMVTQVVKDYRAYENILRVLLAAGVGVAVIGIMAATGYSNYPSAFDGKQIMSTLQYVNATAAYLAVLSFIGVTLWIREKNLVMKFVYGLSTYIMILVVLGAVSKGAWLIFAAGAVLLLIGMPGIYRLKSIYNLGIAIAAAVITASRFIPAITGETQASGLPLVLIGVLIILAGQGLWEILQYIYQNKGKKIAALVVTGVLAISIIAVLIPLKGAVSPTSTSLTPENITTEISQITDLQDTSYITRYDFARWGMAIVKDYPLVGTGAGGWNALYHQYQDYLFWTTEAHNHFIQVWVEAGTIGLLAFLSMWILLLIAVYKIYKARKQKPIDANDQVKATDQWILTWGTVSTALAFGLHASFDFDLSLAALAILLWVLFALINSTNNIEAVTYKFLPQKPVINIAIASVLALVILVCGSSYTAAHSACQQADKVIQDFANS
ncbi:MAG: O-antigen ligase family protein, partial [Syntrophomonadaceae bacterium]|nr:O-antigen ligase family protein [Syntrophomonadaceae bacterium]